MTIIEDVAKVMGNAVGLYINKPNAFVRNQKVYITEDRDVMPYWQNGQAMIPVSFFLQSIAATEMWNKVDDSIASSKKNDCLYAPAQELCDAFGLYSFCDETGLIIYSEEDLQLDWDKNLSLLRKIAECFIFDDVSGAEIIKLIKEKHPCQAHPRLIMTEERFTAIRDELAKGQNCDPVYKAVYAKVKAEADSYLDTNPQIYELSDGVRLLPVSRRVSARVLALSMMYNLTYEEKYAVRCRQEMLAAANFPDWHPQHFLDTGEMTNGLALGYDWLYNWLDKEDRELIRNAIVDKGFKPLMDDYNGSTIKPCDHANLLSRTWLWLTKPVSNWRFVGNGGIAVGALAVADELFGDELAICETVLENSLLYIRPSILLFAPEGGYEEGIVYWGFANKYYTYHMSSLISATGKDFGYTDAPGLRKTNEYVYAVNGPVASFSFHDTDTIDICIEPYVMFWANRFENYGTALPRIKRILEGDGNVHDFLYYNPEFIKATNFEQKNDMMLKATGIFTARSGWCTEDTYIGFHADEAFAGPSHDHLDGGSFVLQAMGENFFVDLGKDNYNLPNYYCDAYRTRAEGHNTIVINPDGRSFDQKFAGWSEINKYESKTQGAYAISDLTDLYSEDAESVWRGVKLDNNRKTVTIQDEIIMKKPSEFYWFAHTPASIGISDDGKKAYLVLNGKTLLAEIAAGEGAAFSVMEAKPLPTSPKVAGQEENEGFRKLTIHMTDVTNLNLTVIFNNYDSNYNVDSYIRDFIPLSEWSI